MTIKSIDIQIFGRLLKLSCPDEKKDTLIRAAEDLDRRLQDLKERTKILNTEKLIFVTALNISYELILEKTKICKYCSNIEKQITVLYQNIEHALINIKKV